MKEAEELNLPAAILMAIPLPALGLNLRTFKGVKTLPRDRKNTRKEKTGGGMLEKLNLTSPFKGLGNTLKEGMIRSAFRSRIIHFIKSFGKLLKGTLLSYILPPIGGLLIIHLAECGSGGSISYGELGLGWLPLTFLASAVTIEDFDPDYGGVSGGNDGRKERESGEVPERSGEEETNKVGVQVCAVSGKKQAEEGHSIEAQLDRTEEIAERNGIALPHDPLVADGESGKDSVRKSLCEALRLAERGEITHVVCVSLDRIGRHLPQCLNFAWELREEGVKLLTGNGVKDIKDMSGLMEVTIEFLQSHVSNRERSKAMLRAKVQSFREGNFGLESRPGYRKMNGEWEREPDRRWQDFVHDMFEKLVETECYQAAADHLNEEYQELMDDGISASQVRSAIQDPVYKGKPTMFGEMVEDMYDGPVEVDRPDLTFIGEDLFEKAQKSVESISEKYSQEDKTLGPKELAEKFEVDSIAEEIPELTFMCRECMCDDCPAEMVKNGTRENGEQVWMCRDGKHQRRIPTRRQLEDLDGTDHLCCPVCGTLDDMEVQEELDGKTNFECRSCGFRFRTDERLDKIRKVDKD